MNFPLTNSGCVLSNAAFSWSNWEQRINCLVFWKGAHNRGLLSNPIIYTTSPSLDEDRPLVRLVVVHSACPEISSVPHYCAVSTFHRLSQFVLKLEHFCLRLRRELHAGIRSILFFFFLLNFMWNLNIKVMSTI